MEKLIEFLKALGFIFDYSYGYTKRYKYKTENRTYEIGVNRLEFGNKYIIEFFSIHQHIPFGVDFINVRGMSINDFMDYIRNMKDFKSIALSYNRKNTINKLLNDTYETENY